MHIICIGNGHLICGDSLFSFFKIIFVVIFIICLFVYLATICVMTTACQVWHINKKMSAHFFPIKSKQNYRKVKKKNNLSFF